MTRIDIIRIQLRTIAHVSENQDKVTQALLNCLPPSLREKKRITSVKSQGTYKNPISLFSWETTRKKELRSIFQYWKSFWTEDQVVFRTLLTHGCDLDEGSLFFRFDKGKALEGDLSPVDGSYVIHVEIKLAIYGKKPSSCEDLVSQLLSQY